MSGQGPCSSSHRPSRNLALQLVAQVVTVGLKEQEVLRAIVRAVAVSVMDHLAWPKHPAELLAHHLAVLQHIAVLPGQRVTVAEHQDIAALVHMPAPSPLAVSLRGLRAGFARTNPSLLQPLLQAGERVAQPLSNLPLRQACSYQPSHHGPRQTWTEHWSPP